MLGYVVLARVVAERVLRHVTVGRCGVFCPWRPECNRKRACAGNLLRGAGLGQRFVVPVFGFVRFSVVWRGK